MKKRYIILYIVMALFFIIMMSLAFINYLKPNNIKYNIIDNLYANVSIKNDFKKCKIKTSILVTDKDIISILKADKYKNKKDYYVKEESIENDCKAILMDINNKIIFKLKGNKNIEINYKSEYKDAGYTLNKDKYKVKKIKDIDVNKLGIQYVVYRLNSQIPKFLFRKVIVVDKEAPVINLVDKENITLYLNSEYSEPGYSAEDNYDGVLTDKVKVDGSVDSSKVGTYKITYTVIDSSSNETKKERIINVIEKPAYPIPEIDNFPGLTYINGILIVNKKYSLPENYNPGTNALAFKALTDLQKEASSSGYDLPLVSGFRSYSTQEATYYNYVSTRGIETANSISAKPGHSEHQTGLAFDVGSLTYNFSNTPSGKWLAENCYKYGFIIRYPNGKQSITGYIYEPWHIRYLGTDIATKIKESGLSLEEYLGIQ